MAEEVSDLLAQNRWGMLGLYSFFASVWFLLLFGLGRFASRLFGCRIL